MAASVIELLQLPLREIKTRYTKSEMFILAWRSMEQYQQTKRQMKRARQGTGTGIKYEAKEEKPERMHKHYESGQIPEGLPDKFFDEEGGVNLSKVTGEEAVRYLNLIGIPVSRMGGVARETGVGKKEGWEVDMRG